MIVNTAVKQKLPYIISAALLALVAFGAYWFFVLQHYESTDDAYTQAHTTVISPKVTGYINHIEVGDNQRVSKDFCMIKIDDSDYQAALKSAEANVAARDATLQSLRDKIDLQQSIILKAKATVAKSKAEQDRANKDLERTDFLLKQDFVARQKYDSLKAAALSAQADLREAQAGLVTEEKQLNYINSSILEQEALKKQAVADLQRARNDVTNTILYAPFDGVVGNKGIQVGQLVRPGMNLLTLVPANASFVVANFKETQITRMKPGQEVSLKVDAYPDIQFKGVVDSLSPATGSQFSLLPPDNATGNFTKIIQRVPVKIKLVEHNADLDLIRPGLSVVVTVCTR
ncbi:MAG: HlyD family secretion protein [Caedimonadaceae bacterium]|nr:MAG: HlyD family secretion protein [Caedimonadaceae bacterium]